MASPFTPLLPLLTLTLTLTLHPATAAPDCTNNAPPPPQSEIYKRSVIEERCDVSVEIHFWRRRQVVVKRFKLDLLTRDNIRYFKVRVRLGLGLGFRATHPSLQGTRGPCPWWGPRICLVLSCRK